MAAVTRLSVAAGATDLLIENPAVAIGLWSQPSDKAARVAQIAGRIKLALVGVVLLAVLVALFMLLAK
jgi:hypothetical protein